MCGIAGFLLSPHDLELVSADDMLKTLALEIETRGRDATGVGRLTKGNRFRVSKAPTKATTYFEKHPQIGESCRLAIVHTRAWTKGDAKHNENNHPITSGPITGIHNGIVSNDDALFAKYKWNRAAEVDSEAIFTAIHNLGWKDALELLEGSIACAWHDMTKIGHLFVARHTNSPLHIGISDTGSVIFASTNAAVAKAAAALGATNITIDSIKEGVMCEFWTDDDGKLMSNIEEFTPPKVVWSRVGTYEHVQGAWFPNYGSSRTNVVSLPATKGSATTGKASDARTSKVEEPVLGLDGWVLKVNDPVVFIPEDDRNFTPVHGVITFYGGRRGHVYVDVEFDRGLSDELCLPARQLLPRAEYLRSKWAKNGQLALPAVDEKKDDLVDFIIPRSTTELVEAIEDIYGPDTLQLMPGFMEWDRGEYPEMELIEGVIDVEEVSTDG